MRIAVLRLHRRVDRVLSLLQRQTGKLDLAGFRQHDAAFAIDGAGESLRNSAPQIDAELIAGPEHVVRAEGNIQRHRCGGGQIQAPLRSAGSATVAKYLGAESPQVLRRIRNLRVEIAQREQIVGRGPAQYFGLVGQVSGILRGRGWSCLVSLRTARWTRLRNVRPSSRDRQAHAPVPSGAREE